MPTLNDTITNAASAFAATILEAIKGASVAELLALQGATKVKPGRKPGRPPKSKPGRKPGRPARVTAKKVTKKTAKTAANKKRSINYPKCSVPGCGKNRYAKGNGMCGEHFKASKAG